MAAAGVRPPKHKLHSRVATVRQHMAAGVANSAMDVTSHPNTRAYMYQAAEPGSEGSPKLTWQARCWLKPTTGHMPQQTEQQPCPIKSRDKCNVTQKADHRHQAYANKTAPPSQPSCTSNTVCKSRHVHMVTQTLRCCPGSCVVAQLCASTVPTPLQLCC